MKLKEKILEIMYSDNYIPLELQGLLEVLHLKKKEIKILKAVLLEMERERLIFLNDDKYENSKNLIRGKISLNDNLNGFLIPDDKKLKNDIFIYKTNLNGAYTGDLVEVLLLTEATADKKPEGKVIRILERGFSKVVGKFQSSNKYGFVVPTKKLGFDVFIPKSAKSNAKEGDIVLAKIVSYPDFALNKSNQNPEGVILEILGREDFSNINMLSIIKQNDLSVEFPRKIIEYLDNINDMSEKDKAGRKDYTKILTVTIDGKNAKDFDDAISISKEDDGKYKLSIHIADVSHYVKRKSPLDYEAFKRGNSIYLLNQVIPMLPDRLSNDLCSLIPGEERFCLTCEMIINDKGKIIDDKLYESVIKSDYRLIYDEVSDFLEDGISNYNKELENNLKNMENLFMILRNKRMQKGSIAFDFAESEFEFDNEGNVLSIKKGKRRVAEKIIEEFMIITNETVAQRFAYMDIPFVYRIHEKPSDEDVRNLNEKLKVLGYNLKGQNIHSKDYQKILDEIKGKKEEILISSLLLRSLKKARYSVESNLHFGLASMFYSHFTAPIRRYSDLSIHRIVKRFIKNDLIIKNLKNYVNYLKKVADNCSKIEIRTEEIERQVKNVKKSEYMENFIGREFDGVISSLTNFGIFVQLENTVEGLVRFETMKDDYYTFIEESYMVMGRITKKVYKLGDEVKIIVSSVNKMLGKIDFEFIG